METCTPCIVSVVLASDMIVLVTDEIITEGIKGLHDRSNRTLAQPLHYPNNISLGLRGVSRFRDR